MNLADLPLFATDKELAEVFLGKRAYLWPQIVAHYEGRCGMPAVDSLFGGRYVPAVVKFFDALNGITGSTFPSQDGKENPWPAQNPRKHRG